MFRDPDNVTAADPLKSPPHIQPETRSIPVTSVYSKSALRLFQQNNKN